MSTSKVYITALHMKHGGVEMVIASLANALVRRGTDVEILCTYCFGEPAYDLDPKVKITYLTDMLPNKSEFSAAVRSKNPFRILKEGFRSVKILRAKTASMKKAIQNIHSGTVISTRHEHSVLLSEFGDKNVKKIAQLHHDHKFDKKLISDFQTKYGNIDYFTLLTPKLTEEVRGFMEGHNPHTKCITLPNFLTPEKIGEEERGDQLIAAGRLHPDKDFHSMLRIWKKVCDKKDGYILKIAGEGELEGELKALAKDLGIGDKVCFMGGIPHNDLLREMSRSKCYLMTSVSEALPMVLLESMSCGTPAVAFDVRVGPAAVINDGENGFLIPDRDEDLFAKKVIELLCEDGVYSENCKKRAEDFSEEKIMAQWAELLNA